MTDGNWHAATVDRVGQWVTLTLDKGEGRNYNYSLGEPEGHLEIKVSRTSVFAGGDVRYIDLWKLFIVIDSCLFLCFVNSVESFNTKYRHVKIFHFIHY